MAEAARPRRRALPTAARRRRPASRARPSGELAAVAAERDEYLDHLRRLQAEFDNYRKRVQRDNEELRLRAAEAVVESLLPVIDNMEPRPAAAAEHTRRASSSPASSWSPASCAARSTGTASTSVDVEPGTLFDPTVHEAVLAQPSDEYEEGAVLQVLERGYLLHGRLLRPAKVIVRRGGDERLLPDTRSRQERLAGRDQEGVPQARAPVPPRQEPRRQGGGGEVQGGQPGLRDALRPREAQAVRRAQPAGRLRPRRRLPSRAGGLPGLRPAHVRAGRRRRSTGRPGRHPSGLFGGAAGGRPRPGRRQAAERGADLQVDVTVSFDDSLHGVDRARAGREARHLRGLPRQRRRAGHDAQGVPRRARAAA